MIAEVMEGFEAPRHSPNPKIVIAQSERLDEKWVRIEGELRTRTVGGEAESILRDSK